MVGRWPGFLQPLLRLDWIRAERGGRLGGRGNFKPFGVRPANPAPGGVDQEEPGEHKGMNVYDPPARSRVLYDLYLHRPTGGIYALRRESQEGEWQMTGSVGPRLQAVWRVTRLHTLEYETENLAWVRAEREAGHFDLTG